MSARGSTPGRPLPFGPAQIEAAHARWTSDWLAWEHMHDAEYKARAAAVLAEAPAGSAVDRARLDAIERERLQRYQQRYESYVRTSKAIQGLMTQAG